MLAEFSKTKSLFDIAAKYRGVSRPCIIKWKPFYLHKTITGTHPTSNKKANATTQIQFLKELLI